MITITITITMMMMVMAVIMTKMARITIIEIVMIIVVDGLTDAYVRKENYTHKVLAFKEWTGGSY